jgi:hypothetical protein
MVAGPIATRSFSPISPVGVVLEGLVRRERGHAFTSDSLRMNSIPAVVLHTDASCHRLGIRFDAVLHPIDTPALETANTNKIGEPAGVLNRCQHSVPVTSSERLG